jgi:hypothetical protein
LQAHGAAARPGAGQQADHDRQHQRAHDQLEGDGKQRPIRIKLRNG